MPDNRALFSSVHSRPTTETLAIQCCTSFLVLRSLTPQASSTQVVTPMLYYLIYTPPPSSHFPRVSFHSPSIT